MAEIEEGLVTLLLQDAAVVAAFGDRIFVDRIPDDQDMPYALIRTVSQARNYTQDGPGNARSMLQMDVYASTKSGANANATLIRVVLDGYRGMAGDVKAGHIFVRNARGEWAPDLRSFRRILEVQVGEERN